MRYFKTIGLLAIFYMAFCFNGCSSMNAVTYSYADEYNEKATLTFGEDVSFVAFNGEKLPAPPKGKHWDDKITVPAGIPIEVTTHVSYNGRDHFAWSGWILGTGNWSGEGAMILLPLIVFTLARDILWFPVILVDMITAKSQATNRDVILSYSALENEKKYNVYFKRKKKKYFLYIKETGSGKTIYEQEFERI